MVIYTQSLLKESRDIELESGLPQRKKSYGDTDGEGIRGDGEGIRGDGGVEGVVFRVNPRRLIITSAAVGVQRRIGPIRLATRNNSLRGHTQREKQ